MAKKRVPVRKGTTRVTAKNARKSIPPRAIAAHNAGKAAMKATLAAAEKRLAAAEKGLAATKRRLKNQ